MSNSVFNQESNTSGNLEGFAAPGPRIMAGIRVLEVAIWTYTPIAGAVLAEWGADVIKVEHPETGDPQRGLVTAGVVPTGPGGVDYMTELPNRGKRSIGIDLRSADGRAILLELAKTADVFLTNFLPPARRKLGIDVEDIRAVNPSIIYARGSGQGQRGAESDRGGYDGCTFWSRGGIADSVTPKGMDYPIPMPIPAMGDVTGGMMLAGGVAAALFHRQRTGEAVVVDNSLLATAMWAGGASILAAGLFGMDRIEAPTHYTAPNPISNTYRTSDGRFVTLVMLESDRFWADFVTKAGRPELAEDPRFLDHALRGANNDECIAELDRLFASRTFSDWVQIMKNVEGVSAPVQTMSELIDDPQALANGYVQEVRVASGAKYRVVASPLQFGERPPDITCAPAHGEHTDEILLELGHDMDEIIEFKVSGAVL